MLLEALGGAREGRAADREQVERVHDPAYVGLIAGLEQETWLDADTRGRADVVGSRAPCGRLCDGGGRARRLRARAAAGTPCASGSRDGVLRLRVDRDRRAPCAG